MTYQKFKEQAEPIALIYRLKNLDDLSFSTLESVCHEYHDLVQSMLDYICYSTKETIGNNVEQKILSQIRGVFKYRTKSNFKGYSSYTSSKYDLVQVGYLDLEDNIVFNEIQRPVTEPDQYSIIRYLPGFHVRQYRSCEEYILKLGSTKEIKEVISSEIVEYSSGSYSSKKETYSVIGFLNDNNEFIQYNQIIEEEV